MTTKFSYLLVGACFSLLVYTPLFAQQFTCKDKKIYSNGGALTSPEAEALVIKMKKNYQQLQKKVRSVKLGNPADTIKITKLKKQLRNISTQIALLKKLISSCYPADPKNNPNATPTPKQGDTLANLSTEDIFIWGYGTLTLYKNKPENGKKMAVTTTRINNQGDVTSKHFGPVTGEEKSALEFINTKGPGYFWRKNKPAFLCPQKSSCNQAYDQNPIDLTPKGNVLFQTFEDSTTGNPLDRKPDFFHFDIEASNPAQKISRLARPVDDHQIYPENLLDNGTVIAGVSSPAIDQWFIPFGIMTQPLNVESMLAPSLTLLEEQLLKKMEIYSICKLSNTRSFSVTSLKVSDNGMMTGSFMDYASCFTTNPLDGSLIESSLPPIMGGFKVNGQQANIINETLLIPDPDVKPQGVTFLVHAAASNGVSAGSFMDAVSKKQLIIYNDHVEQVTIDFPGVSRDLLDTEATDGVPQVITSVNKNGQFVGTRPLFYKSKQQKVDFLTEAYFGSNGTVININSLIPKSMGLAIQSADGINDCGAIVGGLKDLKNNEYYGYRLAPSACEY